MNSLLLAGADMITSIGMGAEMVNGSVRAEINRYAQTDIIGHDDDPVRMSLVPQMALDSVDIPQFNNTFDTRQRRLLRLAILGIQKLRPLLPDAPLPLFMAGPEPYVSMSGVNQVFIKSLAEYAQLKIDLRQCRISNTGRAGGLQMIDTAFKYFASTGAHYALVGGVDSYYDFLLMSYLEENARLLKNTTLDGFVPGEGAGFLLLVSPNAPEEIRQQASACLQSPGIAREKDNLLNETVTHNGGLGQALTQALEQAQQPIGQLYSSDNGERYFARELSTALVRNPHSSIKGEYPVCRPAEFFGDLGAAFGPVAIGIASMDMKKRHNAASLVACSSDSGSRAALYMEPVVKTEKKSHHTALQHNVAM